jgi:hypothetical protein
MKLIMLCDECGRYTDINPKGKSEVETSELGCDVSVDVTVTIKEDNEFGIFAMAENSVLTVECSCGKALKLKPYME